jgi:hypothetical protein
MIPVMSRAAGAHAAPGCVARKPGYCPARELPSAVPGTAWITGSARRTGLLEP